MRVIWQAITTDSEQTNGGEETGKIIYHSNFCVLCCIAVA